MDNSEATILIIIASAIVSFIVSYYVIYFAAAAATRELRFNSRMLNRMKMVELKKRGLSMEQIRYLFTANDEQFWEWLSSE